MNVPLCRSECDQWFEDCKNDLACVPNWSKDFTWESGQQSCPVDDSGNPTSCMRIRNIYSSAQDFCEKVWDSSYKVVDDDEPCMTIGVVNYDEENNRDVARQRAEQVLDDPRLIINVNSALAIQPGYVMAFTSLFLLAFRYLA